MLTRALIRDGTTGAWLEFSSPEKVLSADSVDEVEPLLRQVEAWARSGGHAAGYLTYEAAAAMDSAYVCHPAEPGPLAVFGLFAQPRMWIDPPVPEPHGRFDCDWTLDEDYPEYRRKLERIRDEIGAGNVYQVNYTLRFTTPGSAAEHLFRKIGRHATYGAWLDLGASMIVSGSPELFFRLQGDRLTSSPMKGTVARGQTTQEDEQRRLWLLGSAKNRAENLMITDMVRNDIGRIAHAGTVRADAVFDVQPLPRVWQMTSTVTGRVDADLTDIFRGLYPAASITGAPKVASMQLIRSLEKSPRGVYTGAVGFVGPAATGLDAQFNVAIRTAWVDRETGRGRYGAGGGIVWDSEPAEEFEEVALKASALRGGEIDDAEFELLETLGWSRGSGFGHLDAHLARLEVSAEHYGFRFDAEAVMAALKAVSSQLAAQARMGERRRVRLCVSVAGAVSVTTAEVILEPDSIQPVGLAAEPVAQEDMNLRFKTTRRGVYDRAAAGMADGVEALLWNEKDLVTESVIANLVYETDGEFFTPPVADGLLPGVLRTRLLDEGRIRERSLPVAELGSVHGLYLVNALRGWRRARLVEG